MHHCLRVDEIISAVALFCSSDPDLLHLALGCHAFYEPAMDALWAYTPWALGKLMLCFPTEIVQVKRRVSIEFGPSVKVTLSRLPSTSEWARFMHHSRRVKLISLEQPGDEDSYSKAVSFPWETLSKLLGFVPGAALLPNLRVLHMQSYNTSLMNNFLHSCLKVFDLSIGWSCNVEEVPDVLAQLPPWVSQLLVFRIRITALRRAEHTNKGTNEQADLLDKCNKLQVLYTAVTISHATFAKLSLLPNLRSVCLCSPLVLDRTLADITAPGSLRFAALQALRIKASPDDLVTLLSLVTLPAIRILELALILDFDGWDANADTATIPDPSAYRMDRLAMLLAQLPSLVELRIHIIPTVMRRGFAMLPQLVSSEALLPLDTLSNLRILEMRSTPVHLAPETIAALALGWRSLRELHIGATCCGPRGLRFPTPLHLEDLYSFAQYCPDLRGLTVPLAGVGPLAMARAVDAETVAHPSLRELNLLFGISRTLSAKERTRITAFLLAVFPNAIEHLQVENVRAEKELCTAMLLEVAIAESVLLRDGML